MYVFMYACIDNSLLVFVSPRPERQWIAYCETLQDILQSGLCRLVMISVFTNHETTERCGRGIFWPDKELLSNECHWLVVSVVKLFWFGYAAMNTAKTAMFDHSVDPTLSHSFHSPHFWSGELFLCGLALLETNAWKPCHDNLHGYGCVADTILNFRFLFWNVTLPLIIEFQFAAE